MGMLFGQYIMSWDLKHLSNAGRVTFWQLFDFIASMMGWWSV